MSGLLGHNNKDDDYDPIAVQKIIEEKDALKERLLRLIREYGKGPSSEGTRHYLQISSSRRKRLYKEIERVIDKHI